MEDGMLKTFSISLMVAMVLIPVTSLAQPIRGSFYFEEYCAACHGDPDPSTRAPDRETLRQFTPERILDALTDGPMALMGRVPEMTDQEKRDAAEWAAARVLGAVGGDASEMPNQCPSQSFDDPFAGAVWNGWSPDVGNSRFQPAEAAGLSPDQVPRLTLKWAFGYPGGASAASGSPTIVGGRIFVGSDTGFVYSLDAASGCVYWSFEAKGGVRSSITIGSITGHGSAQYAAYFGDVKANAYAVNAETGDLLWTQQADDHPIARITGAPKLHGDRLYVPVSSLEEAAGRFSWYECCTFRGSVVAYNAHTGEQLWKSYSVAEEPKPTTKNSEGVQQRAPAGGAVWNSPVIDAARGVLYVGSGNGYTQPSANDTDSVIALDLETGERLWWHQLTPNDTFLINCPGRINQKSRARNPEPTDYQDPLFLNCPDPDQLTENIDVDVQAVMLHRLTDGRTILIVGQQTGRVYALDPDREGAVIWQLYPGASDRGVITFGGASDGRLVYFPILFQPEEHRGLDIPEEAPRPTGGVAAIRVGTGELAWYTPTPPDDRCHEGTANGCSSGHNGAATAIPGVVFSGAMDGMLRAYSTNDGTIIWEYDTAQKFETVNAVEAKGGALNGPGPTVLGGMLYTGSGYAIAGGVTGNVLLAFGID